MKHYLSVVSIIKNEDSYLDEFINYYRILGVDHFYFYDNDSDISLKESLSKHTAYITINEINGKAKQMDAYNHFIASYGSETRWAAFIDIDEFILPKQVFKLSDYLKTYEHADALAVNWVFFGDNNHIEKPLGLVIENFIRSERTQNVHIKTIANPQKIVAPENPHFMKMVPGAIYIDSKGNSITSAFNSNDCLDLIQINHYYSKSIEELTQKAERGRADSGEKRDVSLEFAPYRDLWNSHVDTLIADRYLDLLKNIKL